MVSWLLRRREYSILCFLMHTVWMDHFGGYRWSLKCFFTIQKILQWISLYKILFIQQSMVMGVVIVSNYKCTCPHKYICFTVLFLTLRMSSFKNIYRPEKKRRATRSINPTDIKKHHRDFPVVQVVKSLPFNAGDTGSIPQGTKMPHAEGQLSLHTTTREHTQQQRSTCQS